MKFKNLIQAFSKILSRNIIINLILLKIKNNYFRKRTWKQTKLKHRLIL